MQEQIKKWWQDHPQDYKKDGNFDRQNIFTKMDDMTLMETLQEMDKHMADNAYYMSEGCGILSGGVYQHYMFSKFMPDKKWMEGKKVLEIGCGLGAHCETLSRLGAEVTAIDLNMTSVEITGRRMDFKCLPAKVMQADAEKLPFEDNTFDYIWTWGVIHHSENTQKCVDEIKRVLKPGGKLGIMLYNKHSVYSLFNVFFLKGILKGELLKKTPTELTSRYADGREFGGCPMARYYSRKEIREMFKPLECTFQHAYGQKKSLFGIYGKNYKWMMWLEKKIPNKVWIKLLSRTGFLTFSEFKK